MWPCPAVAGTGLATRKSRGVDRHGLVENGLGLRRGWVMRVALKLWSAVQMPGGIFICATYGLKTQGEKRLGMIWKFVQLGPSESAVGSYCL